MWNSKAASSKTHKVISKRQQHKQARSSAPCTQPQLRTLLVSLNDSTPGRRAESGTKQRSKVMSAFCTQRSAILFSILVVLKPGVPLRTRKQLTCVWVVGEGWFGGGGGWSAGVAVGCRVGGGGVQGWRVRVGGQQEGSGGISSMLGGGGRGH